MVGAMGKGRSWPDGMVWWVGGAHLAEIGGAARPSATATRAVVRGDKAKPPIHTHELDSSVVTEGRTCATCVRGSLRCLLELECSATRVCLGSRKARKQTGDGLAGTTDGRKWHETQRRWRTSLPVKHVLGGACCNQRIAGAKS